jgi:hypothetical protein
MRTNGRWLGTETRGLRRLDKSPFVHACVVPEALGLVFRTTGTRMFITMLGCNHWRQSRLARLQSCQRRSAARSGAALPENKDRTSNPERRLLTVGFEQTFEENKNGRRYSV